MTEGTKTIALAGNPNVGKSTLFNALTGLRQHTGNWPGKTVEVAEGLWRRKGGDVRLLDLPGTYTLGTGSPEEELAAEMIASDEIDGVIVVCDAVCLERSLILALQVLLLGKPALLCVNLMDEADRKHLAVDTGELEALLGVPVISMSAGRKRGLNTLSRRLEEMAVSSWVSDPNAQPTAEWASTQAERLAAACTAGNRETALSKGDRILLRRETAVPLLVLLLGGVLWITLVGANLPSRLLSGLLLGAEGKLERLFQFFSAPDWLTGLLVEGVYRVLAWVVSVMLPPMAIFFPLFTLLEEWGFLPRVAFVMDHAFCKCGGCGRQGLTLCMSLGCNAVGVSGCRIIESPRERLIAILTASFVPCNGRFPTLVAILTMFFAAGTGQLGSAVLLLGVILLGIVLTLGISKLLSVTVLKGEPSGFVMELPPFRRPQIGRVIVRSLLDRTVFVCSRALMAAAPAGAVIWLLANLQVGERSLLLWCTQALEPVGRFLGLDGAILMAFLLGFPANEIVLPIVLMTYLATGGLTDYSDYTTLHTLLVSQGWTWVTALCMLLFSLLHWPCAATCYTIQKETGKLRWTLLAILLPTLCGVLLCSLVAGVARFFGI